MDGYPRLAYSMDSDADYVRLCEPIEYQRHEQHQQPPLEKSENVPLLASLGLAIGEGMHFSDADPEEVAERLLQLNDLIAKLEDTTSLLKHQLRSAKRTLRQEGHISLSSRALPLLVKYELLIIAILQVISLSILAGYDNHWKGNKSYDIAAKVFMVLFQSANSVIVILATVILSRKLKQGGVGAFLAQTYITTVLVFAGLYFLIYRFEPTSWEFSSDDELNHRNAFVQFIRMMYLSVSSATLCGAANIQPKAWYVTLIVCGQSLINFVYFASILAQSIGNYQSYTVRLRRPESFSGDSYFRSGSTRSFPPRYGSTTANLT